jgi:ribosomal protein S1
MDGLVHISELAENPNVKPQQIVKIRQKVRVKVLKIDIGNKKLNLSLKKANDSTSSNIKKKNNISDERIISDISQDIKNLWDYYINIQEYLLQEKSRPIAIKSDTIDFRKTDGKFYVEIDDENKNQIQQVMAKDLHLEEFDLNDKFVYVDSLLWNTMSPTEKERIKTKLSLLNADLNIIPTVDVDIKYGQDIERSDLLTYDELHEMDKAMQEGTTIHGEIDDIAAFICKVKFDQEFHIYNLFGEHAIRQHSNQRLTYNLRYANSYIPEETYTDLSKNIGLTLKNYCLYFKYR